MIYNLGPNLDFKKIFNDVVNAGFNVPTEKIDIDAFNDLVQTIDKKPHTYYGVDLLEPLLKLAFNVASSILTDNLGKYYKEIKAEVDQIINNYVSDYVNEPKFANIIKQLRDLLPKYICFVIDDMLAYAYKHGTDEGEVNISNYIFPHSF